MFGLQPDILFAVKTDLIHLSLSIPSGCACLPQILIQKPLRLFSISNSLAAFKLKCKKVFDKKRAEAACTSAKGFKIPKVCTHVQSLRSFLRITTRRPVKSKAARYQILFSSRMNGMPYSAMASAASLPAVSAQPLFAPEGESSPITPPTTSPAAYRPGITSPSVFST